MAALVMLVSVARSFTKYWNMSVGDLTWTRYFSCSAVRSDHSSMSPASPMVEVTVGRPRLRERDLTTSLESPEVERSSTTSGGLPLSIMESSSPQTEEWRELVRSHTTYVYQILTVSECFERLLRQGDHGLLVDVGHVVLRQILDSRVDSVLRLPVSLVTDDY